MARVIITILYHLPHLLLLYLILKDLKGVDHEDV